MDQLRQTYRFIESYNHRVGFSPTQREIGAAFGLTPAAAHYRIVQMERRGWVKRSGIRAIMLLGLPGVQSE